jgi:hypothetical protein
MTSRQAEELKSSDPEFWNSLPFECVTDMNEDDVVENEWNDGRPRSDVGDNLRDYFFDVVGDVETANQSHSCEDVKEGVAVRIQPMNGKHTSSNAPGNPSEILVTPLQVTTILLYAIRVGSAMTIESRAKDCEACVGVVQRVHFADAPFLRGLFAGGAHRRQTRGEVGE